MTLAERLAHARAELITAGIDAADAAADVDLYARDILGWDRARLLTAIREPEPVELEPAFSAWIARRKLHEPTAYIVGRREFWNLSFMVGPAVLIPRPETEIIVEEAIGILKTLAAPRVADIGTGSGCLAVSLAHSVPGCMVVATDISEDALEVARGNALAHHVADRITFVHTSCLEGVDGPFDLIVSNPPYVRLDEADTLARAVLREPHAALFGGADGLGVIDRVITTALQSLRPGGWCIMEIGQGQEADVMRLIEARPGLRLHRVRQDLQGIARTVVFELAASAH